MKFVALTMTTPKQDVVININQIVTFYQSNKAGTVIVTTALDGNGGSFSFTVAEDIDVVMKAIETAANG